MERNTKIEGKHLLAQALEDGKNQLHKRKVQINKDTEVALMIGIQLGFHYSWELLRQYILDSGKENLPEAKAMLRSLDIDFK